MTLGNIHETHLRDLVQSDEQRQFGEYKREGLPPRCRRCPVSEFCNGGCPKNRHLKTPNGNPGLNYLYAGCRRFFSYVQPYLDLVENIVAKGYPIDRVTEVVKRLDERSAESL